MAKRAGFSGIAIETISGGLGGISSENRRHLARQPPSAKAAVAATSRWRQSGAWPAATISDMAARSKRHRQKKITRQMGREG